MNSNIDRRVIGFFASDAGHLLLEGSACIVTGSEAPLRSLLTARVPRDTLGNALSMGIRKIRFAAIMQGLAGGGSYAFDETAYAVFFPLANQCGYALEAEKFDPVAGDGVPLVTITGGLRSLRGRNQSA